MNELWERVDDLAKDQTAHLDHALNVANLTLNCRANCEQSRTIRAIACRPFREFQTEMQS
jgi:hypothetical protein